MCYNVSAELFAEWIATISRALPQCLVTFDDGNKSDIEIALPILKKHNVAAKFFPTISQIGGQDYMTWDDIRSLMGAGMQIGSHGLNHVAWTKCTSDQLLRELQQSRAILEQELETCLSPLKLCHYLFSSGVLIDGTEETFRRRYIEAAARD